MPWRARAGAENLIHRKAQMNAYSLPDMKAGIASVSFHFGVKTLKLLDDRKKWSA